MMGLLSPLEEIIVLIRGSTELQFFINFENEGRGGLILMGWVDIPDEVI